MWCLLQIRLTAECMSDRILTLNIHADSDESFNCLLLSVPFMWPGDECVILPEIWANAHGTRDTGCIGLSAVIFDQNSFLKCASKQKITKNLLNRFILVVKGRSMSSMLVPSKNSSAVLVTGSSKWVSVGNRYHDRLVDSNWNRAFWRKYTNSMPLCEGLFEPKGSKLKLLESTFNAENFTCRLSSSIFSDFNAIRFWNVCRSRKSQKYPWGLESLSPVFVMICSTYVCLYAGVGHFPPNMSPWRSLFRFLRYPPSYAVTRGSSASYWRNVQRQHVKECSKHQKVYHW